MQGRGLYFARSAGYSHFYATTPSDQNDLEEDECEFMLATLLIGDVIEMDRDIDALREPCRTLVTPPQVAAVRQGGLGQ
jgi:hypothetical protein|eukprot:COSAG06_NODE_3238_length_5631_cov_20.701193_1_plen_79_part_00